MEKQAGLSAEQIKNYVRAAVYIRTAANNAEAAAEQRKECMQYIDSKGYTFIKEYADTGASGLQNIRSGFDAMTIDAHLSEFDKIIVLSASRISRSAGEMFAFCRDLQESCGVVVEFVESMRGE